MGRMLEPDERCSRSWVLPPSASRDARCSSPPAPRSRPSTRARHHQPKLGEDGVRDRGGGRGAGAEVTLDQRADGACRAPAARPRLRQTAAENVQRREGARGGARHFLSVAAVADYTPVASRAQAQEVREQVTLKWCRRRTSSPTSRRCRTRRSASGSPPRARTSRTTPRRSAAQEDPDDRREPRASTPSARKRTR